MNCEKSYTMLNFWQWGTRYEIFHVYGYNMRWATDKWPPKLAPVIVAEMLVILLAFANYSHLFGITCKFTVINANLMNIDIDQHTHKKTRPGDMTVTRWLLCDSRPTKVNHSEEIELECQKSKRNSSTDQHDYDSLSALSLFPNSNNSLLYSYLLTDFHFPVTPAGGRREINPCLDKFSVRWHAPLLSALATGPA